LINGREFYVRQDYDTVKFCIGQEHAWLEMEAGEITAINKASVSYRTKSTHLIAVQHIASITKLPMEREQINDNMQ
jgi:hypothetical protein